jgi:hypothetical protein
MPVESSSIKSSFSIRCFRLEPVSQRRITAHNEKRTCHGYVPHLLHDVMFPLL